MAEETPLETVPETVEQKMARVNSLHEQLRLQYDSIAKVYRKLAESGDLFYRLSAIMGHPAQPDVDALNDLLGDAATNYQQAWIEVQAIAAVGAVLCDHITGLQNDINLEILSPPPP